MQMVLTEGYRGLGLVLDLTLDRVLVPAAIVVALVGAALIGVQLSDMLSPATSLPYQL
ncbi:MAG: hypothetical protein AB7U46_06820 [Paenirhodobacter sp.]|uniref:hypothetical protein n=1 Tax=Paenirhodobacter sp. TaxID=1965326 RepID=UPI003D0E0C56